MKTPYQHADLLAKNQVTFVDLTRNQFAMLRRGGDDMAAWQRTHKKLGTINRALPQNTIDTVAEVRKLRRKAA